MNADRAKAKDQRLMLSNSTIQRFNDSTIQQFFARDRRCATISA
jgi:hypothetical protein